MNEKENVIIEEPQKKIKCYYCECELIEEDATYTKENTKQNGEDTIVCLECIDNLTTCEDCDKLTDDSYKVYKNGNSQFVCSRCREDYSSCYHCDNMSDNVLEDNNGDCYCDSCRDNGYGEYEDNDDDFSELKNDTKETKHQDTDKGDFILSTRKFSTEIECYYPDYENTQIVYNAIKTKFQGTGITHDGSLNSKGIEYQTPILQGKKGEDYIKNFTKLLSDSDYHIDGSCGLHIHLDGEGFLKDDSLDEKLKITPDYWYNFGNEKIQGFQIGGKGIHCDTLKKAKTRAKKFKDEILNNRIISLFKIYFYAEQIFTLCLPYSRRCNSYCRPLQGNVMLPDNCYKISELEKSWYKARNVMEVKQNKSTHYNDTRYHGVNFHCLFTAQNLEIRHHTGTLNSSKILYWIQLHQAIMDNSITNSFGIISQLKDIVKLSDNLEKVRKLGEILNLPPDTQKYFIERFKKFSPVKADDNQDSELTTQLQDNTNQII